MSYDILCLNANIIDGSGKKIFKGDVGVKNGKIKFIGRGGELETKEIIDCTNLYLSPGFIDIHSHNDMKIDYDSVALDKLSQGITTEVVGNCGVSMAPVRKNTLQQYKKYIASLMGTSTNHIDKYTTYANYFEDLKKSKTSLNYAFLVGHGTIRAAVIGFDNREPTKEELEQMKDMVREAMESGAIGLSSGLIYPPGVYAKENEIIELCKVVKEYDGYYATHMRNESNEILSAIDEAINVAKETGISVLISHHKIAGKRNWGLSEKTLEKVSKAISDGYDIAFDQYPYTSGMTNLNIVIPPNFMSEGLNSLVEKLKDRKTREQIKDEMINQTYNWDNFYENCNGFNGVLIIELPNTKEAIGKTIAEYAKSINKDEFETFFDILVENNGEGLAAFFAMSEEDIERIMKFPYTMIGTDGILKNMEDPTHPRAMGTFTRVLGKYTREKGIIEIEDAIRKMTYLPATKAKLCSKGLIKEDYDADIVIFDYDEVEDSATYTNPTILSKGIKYVIVNGILTYKDYRHTGSKNGKIIQNKEN